MAQSDNIPAMLQSGEYVVRKEAVDKLGKNTMDMINNADRLGYAGGGLVPQGEHGHSAIDELLALNTLANQRSVDMTRDSAMMNEGGKAISKKVSEQPQSLDELIQLYKNQYDGNVPMSLYIRQLQGLQNPEQDILAEILGRTPLSDDRPDLFRYDPKRFKEQMEEFQKGGIAGYKNGGKTLPVLGYTPSYKVRTGTELPAEVLEQPQSLGALIQAYEKQYDGAYPMSLYIRQIQGLHNPEQEILAEILGTTPKLNMRPELPRYRPEEFKEMMEEFQNGGSVGVVNEIGKSRKMFSNIDDLLKTAAMLDRYNFGPMQRESLSSMREADMIDPKDAMEQVMMLLKAREQNKVPSFEKSKSYLEGGDTGYSAPSGTSTAQSYTPSFLQKGFDLYGGRPEDAAILNRVTELFGFDPSVGAEKVQDMIGDYRSNLTGLMPSVQQYGGGFEGFGGRQQAVSTARTGAYSGIDRAATDIASSEQDRQMSELIAYLTQLETQGGVEFT